MSSIDDNLDLLEEIASWDEEEYPLAKHARRILDNHKQEQSS